MNWQACSVFKGDGWLRGQTSSDAFLKGIPVEDIVKQQCAQWLLWSSTATALYMLTLKRKQMLGNHFAVALQLPLRQNQLSTPLPKDSGRYASVVFTHAPSRSKVQSWWWYFWCNREQERERKTATSNQTTFYLLFMYLKKEKERKKIRYKDNAIKMPEIEKGTKR